MKAFFSSTIVFLLLFSSATMAKDGHEPDPSLPKMFLKTGVFASDGGEITIQQSEFPGYQYIQALGYNEDGQPQRFSMYRNAYTGEFYNKVDGNIIRQAVPKRMGLSRPDLSQRYVPESISRDGSLFTILLNYGELTSERRYVDVIIDESTATIKSLTFSVQQPTKRFLGVVPYKYRAIDEATIEDCEEQLVI